MPDAFPAPASSKFQPSRHWKALNETLAGSSRLVSPAILAHPQYPSPPMSEPRLSPPHLGDRRALSRPVSARSNPVQESYAGSQAPTNPGQGPQPLPIQSPSSLALSSSRGTASVGGSLPAVSTSPGGTSQRIIVDDSNAQRGSKTARRTKAHVPSACVNCKRAHLSCDVQRPCTRCVTSGKQDTCFDVQHKKRGRPRLRDRTETIESENAKAVFHADQTVRVNQGNPVPSPSMPHTDVFRSILSRESSDRPLSPQSTLYRTFDSDARRPDVTSHPYHPPESPAYASTKALAFANLDLTIIKANKPFTDTVMNGEMVARRNLGDLLDPRHADALQRLRNDLRQEKEDKNPAYMPPIRGSGEESAIETVNELDVGRLTADYVERNEIWTFTLADSLPRTFRVSIRLAKTNVFFAVLTVHLLERSFSSSSNYSTPGGPSLLPDIPPFATAAQRNRERGPASRGSKSSTATSSGSSPQYFTSPTLTATHPPTPLLGHGSPYRRAPTPREHEFSPALSGPIPPPVSLPPYSPAPPGSSSGLKRPHSRQSVPGSDASIMEPQTQIHLPPLRFDTPVTSPSSHSIPSITNVQPSDQYTQTFAPAPEQNPRHDVGASRPLSLSGTDGDALLPRSPPTEENRKRRRLNMGIHEVLD